MRRSRLTPALVLVALGLVAAATAAAPFPGVIELPTGWRPEGIEAGKQHTLYVGSIPTGDVRQIDARTGEQFTLVDAPAGRAATGLEYDQKGERLFVAMRRGTNWSIGHVSASTGETTTVFSLPTAYGYVRYPAVSPKGDQVVFEQTETPGNIWQISLWDQTRGRAR